MPHCELSATRLYYEEKGEGEPLVFLNGLSGDHLYWRGQLRFFGKRFRCLALENRDVGLSSYATAPYTIADMAQDVCELFERLHLPPAHVVGLSMGGMIAQELALRAPERVRSLTLASSLARSDEWFRGTLTAFNHIRRTVADTPSFFDVVLAWWVGHRFFAESERTTWLRWFLRQNPHPQALDGFLRQMDAIHGHDALERLQRIDCPTLVLAGEDDTIVPPRYGRELAARIPGARLVILPEVGHAPPFENPGFFNKAVADFLHEQAPARPALTRQAA